MGVWTVPMAEAYQAGLKDGREGKWNVDRYVFKACYSQGWRHGNKESYQIGSWKVIYQGGMHVLECNGVEHRIWTYDGEERTDGKCGCRKGSVPLYSPRVSGARSEASGDAS